MTRLLGRPLDKLARALFVAPQPDFDPAVIHEELVTPVIELRDVMGQVVITDLSTSTNTAANTVLNGPAVVGGGAGAAQALTEGFYEIFWECHARAPVAGFAAVRQIELQVLDETGVLFRSVRGLLLAGVNNLAYFRLHLRLKYQVRTVGVDATAIGETTVSQMTLMQRYQ